MLKELRYLSLLTITMRKPKQQMTSVSDTNCISAMFEKRALTLFEKEMIFWCRTTNVFTMSVTSRSMFFRVI